jgi:acetyl esterase
MADGERNRFIRKTVRAPIVVEADEWAKHPDGVCASQAKRERDRYLGSTPRHVRLRFGDSRNCEGVQKRSRASAEVRSHQSIYDQKPKVDTMKPRPSKSWISQLLNRDVKLTPRQSPSEIPAARSLWDLDHLNRDLPAMAQVHERVLLRSRQGTDLTAEIYVPIGKGPFPTILYIHGGSWCLWSPAHVRKMTMRMAERGFVVVNLDYGLAPERPFPWAVEDSIYAARWIATNIGQYRGRADKLIVGGDSAGANLASAVVVGLAGGADISIDDPLKGATPTVVGAFLPYGIFDFPLLFSEPGKNAGTGTIETTWNLAYLGPNFVSVHRKALVSPAYWPRLNEFPPSYLTCGARDALLPQTLRMAKALIDADAPTTVSIVCDADHGFLMMSDTEPAAEAELQRVLNWMAEVAE